jgi:hypothetical protein
MAIAIKIHVKNSHLKSTLGLGHLSFDGAVERSNPSIIFILILVCFGNVASAKVSSG